MRRFSQRHLSVLAEINITPLLDLAFVLLIIFIITTPLLTQSIELKLPQGGKMDQKPTRNDIRTVEISSTGYYKLETVPRSLPQIIAQLARDFRNNPNLVIFIRADKDCKYDLVAQLLDGCKNNGLSRYSLRTDPTPK